VALHSKQVRKAARKLRKLLKKSRKQPLPEQVHALRTNIRRLETAVEAVFPKSKQRERLFLRELRRIRKLAGKVRDMDVLTGNAISVRMAPTEQMDMIELLHYLGARRYKQAARFRRMIEKKRLHLAKGIKRLASRVEDRIPDPGG
jgi:CHAD domain-containing protein